MRLPLKHLGFAVNLLLPSLALIPLSDLPAGTCTKTLSRLISNPDSISASAVGIGLLISAGVMTGPTIYHEINASRLGQVHIAYGIYLDMPKIASLLTSSERQLLDNPHMNARKIVELFAEKLNGDYDYSLRGNAWRHWFPSPTSASSYFKGQDDVRGICRHKACILHALLNQLGIKGELQEFGDSALGFGGGHIWVYVPDLDLIVDPTAEPYLIISRNDYLELLKTKGVDTSSIRKHHNPYWMRGSFK